MVEETPADKPAEGDGHQADEDSELLQGKQKHDMFRKRKEFGVSLVRDSMGVRCVRLERTCVRAKLLLSHPTLCDSMDHGPPGSCPWTLQARLLKWVALPSSRGSS